MPHDHGATLQFDDSITLTLSTLANRTAILAASNIDSGRDNGFYLIWTKIAGFFRLKTATEGPVIFGICANLSATELTAILTDDPQNSQEPTETGPGSWYQVISLIGLDALEGDINAKQGATNVQAESQFTKYPVKWTIPEDQDFSIFAYNIGAALTTGMIINVQMQNFGAWLRD